MNHIDSIHGLLPNERRTIGVCRSNSGNEYANCYTIVCVVSLFWILCVLLVCVCDLFGVDMLLSLIHCLARYKSINVRTKNSLIR